MQQRSLKTVKRLLHPELEDSTDITGWSGTGGYNTTRLAGYESDIECQIDQYYADEITGAEIYQKYLARSSPVLIRGLIVNWSAVDEYKIDKLTTRHGKEGFTVSSIPYAE